MALKGFWRSSVIFSKNHHRVSLIIFFFKCTLITTKTIYYIIQVKQQTATAFFSWFSIFPFHYTKIKGNFLDFTELSFLFRWNNPPQRRQELSRLGLGFVCAANSLSSIWEVVLYFWHVFTDSVWRDWGFYVTYNLSRDLKQENKMAAKMTWFQLVCLFPKSYDYFAVLRFVDRRVIATKDSSKHTPCMKTLRRRICSLHGLWRRYSTTRRPRNHITSSWRKPAKLH